MGRARRSYLIGGDMNAEAAYWFRGNFIRFKFAKAVCKLSACFNYADVLPQSIGYTVYVSNRYARESITDVEGSCLSVG